jgi:ribokinase
MIPGIVVVGSLNMDLVVFTPRHPQIGETILGNSFQTNPGGKGANQAVAAAQLGVPVQLIGKLGNDPFGDQLLASLHSSGVDTRWVLRDEEAATGTALITVDAAGANTIIVVPGSNMKLAPQDVVCAEAGIVGASLLIMQLEVPLETVLRAAEIAHQHSVKVILNPAPAQALPDELLGLVDILVVNESEMAILTDSPVDTEERLLAAAQKLKKMAPAELVLTLGEKGSIWLGEKGLQKLAPFPVQAVDTTAAGDAFIGGLAAALWNNRPMQEALEWGNAAGALAVTRTGAQPSLPDRNEVENLLQSYRQSG